MSSDLGAFIAFWAFVGLVIAAYGFFKPGTCDRCGNFSGKRCVHNHDAWERQKESLRGTSRPPTTPPPPPGPEALATRERFQAFSEDLERRIAARPPAGVQGVPRSFTDPAYTDPSVTTAPDVDRP